MFILAELLLRFLKILYLMQINIQTKFNSMLDAVAFKMTTLEQGVGCMDKFH